MASTNLTPSDATRTYRDMPPTPPAVPAPSASDWCAYSDYKPPSLDASAWPLPGASSSRRPCMVPTEDTLLPAAQQLQSLHAPMSHLAQQGALLGGECLAAAEAKPPFHPRPVAPAAGHSAPTPSIHAHTAHRPPLANEQQSRVQFGAQPGGVRFHPDCGYYVPCCTPCAKPSPSPPSPGGARSVSSLSPSVDAWSSAVDAIDPTPRTLHREGGLADSPPRASVMQSYSPIKKTGFGLLGSMPCSF